ncbi:hypothetical protein EHM76_00570 [bacterium]|nr:MAG: hypothetical protein EHM76_00570 [bacterium]
MEINYYFAYIFGKTQEVVLRIDHLAALEAAVKEKDKYNRKLLDENIELANEAAKERKRCATLTTNLINYFTAAEFENVEEMVAIKPPEFYKLMGKEVATRTKSLKAEIKERNEDVKLLRHVIKIGEAAEHDKNRQIAALKAERSDAWALAFNLWPGAKEPSELDLCGVIHELGERHKKQIAALTAENKRLELRTEQAVQLYMMHRNKTQVQLRKEIAALKAERSDAWALAFKR